MPLEPRNLDDPWRKGTVARQTCPWPYCRGFVNILRHPPSSDRLNELVDTVEPHAIVGENYWYQPVCPGSYLLIPFSKKGREVLLEHGERFRVALAERLNTNNPQAASDLADQNAEIEARKRAGTLGHLDQPAEHYFPHRPSDVEEAQNEYRGVLPPHAQGIRMITGRGSMTSANDTTINLITLAKQNVSSAQEDCSRATNILDLLDTALKSVDEHLQAAGQLVAAAAMSSGSTPRLADEGAQNIAQASVHLDDATARAAGTDTRISDAFASMHHAIEKLDEFMQQLQA